MPTNPSVRQGALALAVLALIQPSLAEVFIDPDPDSDFKITWDGNDGDGFDPNPPPAGARVPDNLALASNGATAISSSDLGPELGISFHVAANLNDGLYGNANSWISSSSDPSINDFDQLPYAGVLFPSITEITAFAFGRDNGNGNFDDSSAGTDACGGQCDDRALGFYEIQITPDGTSWTTIGFLDYIGPDDIEPGNGFTPHLRHRFEISTAADQPISALGLRIVVPTVGLAGGTAIDEIEVYGTSSGPPVLTLAESGGTADTPNNLAATATTFAAGTADGKTHASANDGVYGDASTWAGQGNNPFLGLTFTSPVELSSIAFGRDNTGTLTDRTLGDYTLQITSTPNPDATTPDSAWTTVGVTSLAAGNPPEPSIRHRYNFPTITATGLRLLSPDGAAIDELEAYTNRYSPPLPPPITITSSAGFDVSWDGNDGDHFDPGAPPDGAVVPDNLALASNGATAIASSELGPELGIAFHLVDNLNDGFYGNANSWISASNDLGPPDTFAGIAFPTPTAISRIAWGRDNGNGAHDNTDPGTDACGGQCIDRSLGLYVVQITDSPNPDDLTPPDEWTTVAEIDFLQRRDSTPDGDFTEYLRHEFNLAYSDGSPLVATGIRILVPTSGLGGGTAIDEIEVYGGTAPPPAPLALTAFSHTRDTNTGELTVDLTFNSQPGTFYLLWTSDDLANWREVFDIESQGTSTSVSHTSNPTTPGSTGRLYYQVREFVP